MTAVEDPQLDSFPPWVGIAGLFIAAIGVAMILGILGVIPATINAPGIPRTIIVLVLLPFVAVGLFVALAGLGSLVGSRTIPIVALWIGALGVLAFVASMAVLLTWVAIVPTGSTRLWMFGLLVPLSDTAAGIVDRIVVGGLALLVDAIALGCFIVVGKLFRASRDRHA